MSYAGTVVLNYRLVRKLGEGGFGTVYLAEHADLGRKAACKILHREFATKPEVVERFFREAKAVCAIGHRAIIDIENFGALPTGEPFYLMEYFPGESLADFAQRGPLQPPQLVTVFDAVASALTAAHAKQIIHRDLKPENIMVSAGADGAITDVKLLDFGIAKLVGDSDSVRSRSNTSMGTPAFMSPEQARDAKSVDARSDVYSFAATIYAAIAGQPPFVGDSVSVLVKTQLERPVPLESHVPEVPLELARALEHCLAKTPEQRPPTIADAWREIRDTLGTGVFTRTAVASTVAATLPPGAETVAPTAVPAPPATVALRKPSPSPTTLGAAASESMPLPARSKRPVAIVLGLALVAVIAVVVIATSRRDRTPQPATTPTSRDATAAVSAPDATIAIVATDAEAADAAVIEPDAATAVAVDAGSKPDRPRPRPPTPTPTPTPARVCTTASFAAVYTKPAPDEAEVRSALERLNKCRGELAPDTFAQIQKNLVSKL